MTEVKTNSIPPKTREEWSMLVCGKIDHRFKNFVLQMKSYDYSRKIKDGELSIDLAVDELYKLCEKYAMTVQDDFKKIFKEW